jgi:hypothetical protein
MMSKQRRAWIATSGSTVPSGHCGAVPDTTTRSPTRTARLYPTVGSKGDPEEMRRRPTIGVTLGDLGC